MHFDYDLLLDASDEECPIPTIQAKETLDIMSSGEILKLVTGKEGTIKNIRTLVVSNNYELLSEHHGEEGFVFLIRKC